MGLCELGDQLWNVAQLGVTSHQGADVDPAGTQAFGQMLFPSPGWSRPTAVEIEGRQFRFRKSMASQMRFPKQIKSGDSPGIRKLKPLRRADHSHLQLAKGLMTASAE